MTSVGTVISYPISAYQNLPIESQFYQPSRFVISAITRGQTTLVTTSEDHNYVIGQSVRLLIPRYCGIIELNEAQGVVISIPLSTQVTIDIPSTSMNAFVAGTGICQPQILAIGEINSGAINSSGRVSNITYVPGSFLNISPQ